MIKGWLITWCQKQAETCKYWCCNQSNVWEIDDCPENSILLYPWEVEHTSKSLLDCISIKNENFFWGKLWYCKKEKFDQSKCDEKLNLKSLDCQSYPFFPRIVNWMLKLAIDSRCPLHINTNDLKFHHDIVYKNRSQLIKNDKSIAERISSISLPTYHIVEYI